MLKYGKNITFAPEKLHPLNIDRQSVEAIPSSTRVLEIGCATGFMGKYLIKKKHCEIIGVELGLDEAREAKKHLKDVIIGDIEEKETIEKVRTLGKFDVVYASALIEHLKDPWVALRNWKTFLKKDGYLIITTSNIAHWSMRKRLLFGDFKYSQYGILDNTHLRFFTTHTFQSLVKDTGYEIESFSIDAVGGGMPRISKPLSSIFPNLFAYQMLIKAKPR